ncbi:MAG: DnaB-like helicase C-terminal domain-containing protein [Opitutae bacterium]
MIKLSQPRKPSKEIFAKAVSAMGGNTSRVFVIDPTKGTPDKPYKDVLTLDKPVNDPAVIDHLWENHVNGPIRVSLYYLRDTKFVDYIAFDIDDKPHDPNPNVKEQTEQVSVLLDELEIEHDVEVSQSGKGTHVFVWTTGIDATIARNFGQLIEALVPFEIKEVNPKQVTLSKTKGLGNNITIPFHNQSHFVSVEDDWEQVDPKFIRYSEEDLVAIAANLGKRIKPDEQTTKDVERHTTAGLPESVAKLLAESPNDRLSHMLTLQGKEGQTRSDVIHSLTMSLVRRFVSDSDIAQTLAYVCEANDYDKDERWIDLTIEKAHEHHQTHDQNEQQVQAEVQEQVRNHQPMTILDCATLNIQALTQDAVYYETGIQPLDERIRGFKSKTMTIFASAPNMGKSTLSLQALMHISEQGIPTLMIQLEMSPEHTGQRAITSALGITEQQATDAPEETLQKVREYFAGRLTPYFINAYSLQHIIEIIRVYARQYGVKVICLDYLQLIDGGGESEYASVTQASKLLRRVALEEDVALVLLAQIKQDCYPNYDFNQKDIKNSSQIAQDADLILFGVHLKRIPSYKLNAGGEKLTKPMLDNCFQILIRKCRHLDYSDTPISLFFETDRHRLRDFTPDDIQR